MTDTSMNRLLLVYVVLDCSGSTTGEPMEAVRSGMLAENVQTERAKIRAIEPCV